MPRRRMARIVNYPTLSARPGRSRSRVIGDVVTSSARDASEWTRTSTARIGEFSRRYRTSPKEPMLLGVEAAPHPWPALGVLLLRDGFATKEHLEAILDEQPDTLQHGISGRRLGEILVERGVVTETQVARLVAEQYELPFVDLDTSDIDLRVATLLSEELARRFSAVPISSRPDGSVLLAIADPGSVVFSDELRRVLGSTAHFAVVGPDAIEAALAFVHDRPAEPLVVPDPTEATDPDSVVIELRPEGSTPSIPSDDEPFFGSQRAVAQLWPPLGALLIREGLVTDAELEAALGQVRLSSS